MRANKDRGWALATTLAGGAALLFALHARWNAQDLSPGIEGCVTASVVGFVMALLHGLPYLRALALLAPVVAAQLLICVDVGGAALGVGITGLQLVVMGFIGLAMEVGDPRAVARRQTPARPVTTDQPRKTPAQPVPSHS